MSMTEPNVIGSFLCVATLLMAMLVGSQAEGGCTEPKEGVWSLTTVFPAESFPEETPDLEINGIDHVVTSKGNITLVKEAATIYNGTGDLDLLVRFKMEDVPITISAFFTREICALTGGLFLDKTPFSISFLWYSGATRMTGTYVPIRNGTLRFPFTGFQYLEFLE